MRNLLRIFAGAVATGVLAGVAGAQTQDFTFDYTTVAGDYGDLVLTTTSIASGEFLITGISGTRDGQAITSFAADPVGTTPGQVFDSQDGLWQLDNVLYYPASASNPSTPTYVDYYGFLFGVGASEFNIYYNPPSVEGSSQTFGSYYSTGVPLATLNVQAVPEPITMMLGVGAISLAARRRRASKALAV